MLDTTPQVTQFLKENFKPSNLENATLKLTTHQLLQLLFNVFPNGSIDDYDLYQILVNLQYEPFKDIVVVESIESEDETTKENSNLTIVWCIEELS